jgi:serine/threonine protein kinase
MARRSLSCSNNNKEDYERQLQRSSVIQNHSDVILDLVTGGFEQESEDYAYESSFLKNMSPKGVNMVAGAVVSRPPPKYSLQPYSTSTYLPAFLQPKPIDDRHPKPAEERANANTTSTTDSAVMDSAELKKQMKPEVRELSDAIMSLVNDDSFGDDQEIDDDDDDFDKTTKRQALASSREVAARGVPTAEPSWRPETQKGTCSKGKSLCTQRKRDDIAASNEKGVKKDDEEKNAMASSSCMVLPPGLERNGRLPVQPGALRVPGICATTEDDEEEDDSVLFSVTNHSDADDAAAEGKDIQIRTSTTGFFVTDDPIQAVLVGDDLDEIELEKERELAKREARIRARECELERKLQQMEATTPSVAVAVQAQIVVVSSKSTTIPSSKKKKHGLFGLFKVVRGGKKASPRTNSDESSSLSPPKRPSISTTQLVTSDGTESASTLVNEIVANQLGTSSKSSVNDDSSAATMNLSERESATTRLKGVTEQLDTKPKKTWCIPLFERDEIRVGKKQVGRGKFHTVMALQDLVLNDAWECPAAEHDHKWEASLELLDHRREELARAIRMSKGRSSYVVKYLRSDLDARKQGVAALELMAEVSLLAHLNHKNILPVSGMSESTLSAQFGERSFFVIMDRLPENLLDRLTKSWRRKVRGPQFFLDRVKVATDLASVIDYLHSLNIVYSDLKPENVGFDRDGVLKLYNFGGAKTLTTNTQIRKPYDKSCCTTTSPAYVGTHPNVAPEVALKRPSGISVDTYAFSIVLWEIMTMKEPFADLMIHEYTERVIRCNNRPKLDRKTPSDLNDIMSACWHYDPSRRPCMKDVHLKLIQFQEQLDIPPEIKKGLFR